MKPSSPLQGSWVLNTSGCMRFLGKAPRRIEAFHINRALKKFSGKPRRVVVPDGTEVVGQWAFLHCPAEEYVLPPSIARIDHGAFCGSSIRRYVEQALAGSDPIVYGDEIFHKCHDLHTARFAPGFKAVTEFMFRSCSRLATVQLPSSVDMVDDGAFWGCTRYRPDVAALSGLCDIGQSALAGTRAEHVRLPPRVAKLKPYAFQANAWLVAFDGSKARGLLVIPTRCFVGCPALEEAILPPLLEKIADGAFASTGLKRMPRLPETLRWVGNDAFSCCERMEGEVAIPAGAEVRPCAFAHATRITVAVLKQIHRGIPNMFPGCTRLRRVLFHAGSRHTPGTAAEIARYCGANCGGGSMPLLYTCSAIKKVHWHRTTHSALVLAGWQQDAVAAVLWCNAELQNVPPEIMLHILTFLRRDELGRK